MVAPRQPKEATVHLDQPLDQALLAPPEWDIDWDSLFLLDDLPLARTPWYADWDEQE